MSLELLPTYKLKLASTFLSRKPKDSGSVVAVLSLLVLTSLFALNQQHILPTTEMLSASGKQVFQNHEYWRAFTASLVHANFTHLAANSLFFTGLALLLNGYFGALVFPLLSFVAGGVINAITLSFYPPDASLVGVSGVIYYMAAFWMVLYIGIERKASLTRRIINSVALTLVLLFPETFEVHTSYLAHAVGYALGIPSGLAYFFARRSYFRSEETWKVVEQPAEERPEDILVQQLNAEKRADELVDDFLLLIENKS
jgi:rhomboid protease GluP